MAEVTTSVRDGILDIRLNRPGARNALSWTTLEELEAALASAADDPVRCVVLSGEGPSFCAGADLKSDPARTSGIAARADRLRYAQGILASILHLDKPVVAAVEGYAVGIGWGLALACDLVIAAETARFGSPFVARGLVPDGALIWQLVRALGRQRALRILYFSEQLTATDAVACALAAEVAPAGQARQRATELAAQLAAAPAAALMLVKHLATAAANVPIEQYLQSEWLAAALNFTGADAAEGIASFRAGRRPDFRH